MDIQIPREHVFFVLGVLGTILVSIIANLLTPDRDRLFDKWKNWRARRTIQAAKNRIEKLNDELSQLRAEVTEYYAKPEDFNWFVIQTFLEAMLNFVNAVALVGTTFLLPTISFIPGVNSSIVLLPFAVFFFFRANNKMAKLSDLVNKVRNFHSIRSRIELTISSLEKITST